MSKERELLNKAIEMIQIVPMMASIGNVSPDFGSELILEIQELLAQPEQTEPVEICPDCGSKVTWYHCREGTRVVCGDKCQGYKVIASRGRRDECFTKGDL